MDKDWALIGLMLRTGWAVLGMLFGSYALVHVRTLWRTRGITPQAKYYWWLQYVLVPVSGAFVIWTVWGFYGFWIPWTNWLFILMGGSLIAPGVCLGLLSEASKTPKSATAAKPA